ncbi:MAG: ThiF family adenylyltransferase, partial [Chloroflexota bacterium]
RFLLARPLKVAGTGACVSLPKLSLEYLLLLTSFALTGYCKSRAVRREIIFPANTWPSLRAYLLDQGGQEQLAFLLAGVARGPDWLRLLVREAVRVPAEALERQTHTHLVVKPDFSQAILRHCFEEGLSLIEVHSHPFAQRNVAFSATDLANEEKKFRYVAQRIPQVYHATMVIGQSDQDAHLWDQRRRRVVAIDRVRLLDTPITDLIPNSSSRLDTESGNPAPWLARQVLAFGEAGQKRLQAVHVGVVGCGGTGAAVVQMLAHLGVRHLVLVDPDTVELTNLNRLVGATRSDARRGRFKVHVAKRLVRRINPTARVQALSMSVSAPEALAVLKGVDLLFGCTDSHGSRLILNQLAVQYLIPYLDTGAGLRVTPDDHFEAAGGQIRLIMPGSFCLACIDGIDRLQAAQDLMSSLARQRRIARGYIQNADLPTPAVLFLNNILASLAVAEFVNLWTGFRAAAPLLYFDLLHSRLTPAAAERQRLCIACGEGGNLALGDLEPLACVGSENLSDTVPVLQQGKEVVEHGQTNTD